MSDSFVNVKHFVNAKGCVNKKIPPREFKNSAQGGIFPLFTPIYDAFGIPYFIFPSINNESSYEAGSVPESAIFAALTLYATVVPALKVTVAV